MRSRLAGVSRSCSELQPIVNQNDMTSVMYLKKSSEPFDFRLFYCTTRVSFWATVALPAEAVTVSVYVPGGVTAGFVGCDPPM